MLSKFQDILRQNKARIILLFVIIIPILITLQTFTPTTEQSQVMASKVLVQNEIKKLPQLPKDKTIKLIYTGPAQVKELIEQRYNTQLKAKTNQDFTLTATIQQKPLTSTLSLTLSPHPDSQTKPTFTHQASQTHAQWTSLLPPVLAVTFAIIFRKLILSLILSVWLGAALHTHFNPLKATHKVAVDYIYPTISDPFNLYILGFTVSLVGMVHIILRMGGMAGILLKLSKVARSRKAVQLSTALMGGALFFDDYANTVVVGSTMQPVSDQHRISRAKLAYIVDSTSAPIAGLALISTWIGYEVGLFDDLANQLAMNTSGYAIFLNILPLRFYCIFTLFFVIANILTSREFGPMYAAETHAIQTGELLPEEPTLLTKNTEDHLPKEGLPPRWYNAVIPICTVLIATLIGMYYSGWRSAHQEQLPHVLSLATHTHLLQDALSDVLSIQTWRAVFSDADNAKVLFFSALTGSVIAMTLALTQRLLSLKETLVTWLKAIPSMATAMTVLVLAWSIKSVCQDLHTGLYLVTLLADVTSLMMLPLITFLMAAMMAFSTGTSWGTMGILLPTMIPLAHFMIQTGSHDMQHPEAVLMLCFAAVLDGAIFGDHCSPISDTTVMSSIATNSDHVEHVRTQAPYALCTMLIAATLGYLGIPLGLPSHLVLPIGFAVIMIVLFTLGKRIDHHSRG